MNARQLLTPQNALVFRITHVDNVAWVLRNGLHCRTSAGFDPNFRPIGLPTLIERRRSRPVPVPPGGTLADYVPFYFTPWSPMLYNIKTGRNVPPLPMDEIVILVSSVRDWARDDRRFVLSDRHAVLVHAEFDNSLAGLNAVDWGTLQERDFRRSEEDPEKFERYEAEALLHGSLPASALRGLVCYDSARKAQLAALLQAHDLNVPLKADSTRYF